ncbi:hypothetical protein ONZ51_g11800 [Trametes cubensis]|uniref:DUF6699 domain-containing protein n=1 Tax=Trametes cubensis TaxID=1111947 RepID=A0AAD7TH85_9APHY|nr:hypothetical protein ONZ51_g11800 [Trametes cubensis]
MQPMAVGMAGTPIPMFAPPQVGTMQPFIPPVTDGWPRAANDHDQDDEWAVVRHDDGLHRRPSMRSSTPHSHSLSLTSTPSSGTTSLSRRPSTRGPAAEAAKRPPRDWRPDFSMRGPGLFGNLALLTRARSKSLGGSESPPAKVTICSYIRYNSSKPPMWLDLRRQPETSLLFRAVNRPLFRQDLERFACEPPLPHIRLYHVHYPWYIDVDAANPSGVTLFELFCAIYSSMTQQIHYSDFYNIDMNNEFRDQIGEAWGKRCRTEQERASGVRRVDYLMDKYIMLGIQRGRDGLWEIKTGKP